MKLLASKEYNFLPNERREYCIQCIDEMYVESSSSVPYHLNYIVFSITAATIFL